MQLALQEAQQAFEEDEVPVGCVIVHNTGNNIVVSTRNLMQQTKNPNSHAEILAITAACNYLGSKYLDKCTLYVTLEPCMMCTGAIREAQVQKVVYGASDNSHKKSQPNLFEVQGGILEDACSILIKRFFKLKRL